MICWKKSFHVQRRKCGADVARAGRRRMCWWRTEVRRRSTDRMRAVSETQWKTGCEAGGEMAVPAVTDVSIVSVVLLQAARSAPAKPPATPCDPSLCDFGFVFMSDVRAPLCPSSAFVFPPFWEPFEFYVNQQRGHFSEMGSCVLLRPTSLRAAQSAAELRFRVKVIIHYICM